MDFRASNSRTTSAYVVMRRDATPPERIADRLLERCQYKITVQRQASGGYLGYHVRPESIQHRIIERRQAWSAVADYTNAQGDQVSEYVAFAQSEKTAVFFSVTAAARDFARVQNGFEPVILTAQVP